VGGTAAAVGIGSSRACKCRWAPYTRSHDLGQGQLPVSTIKAPGHRIPDARGSTRPIPTLGVCELCGNVFEFLCCRLERLGGGRLAFVPVFRHFGLRNRIGLLHLRL